MEKNIQNNEEIDKINAEIFSHMSNPRNYGEMKESSGVGKCVNVRTTEFLIVYIKVNDENIIEDIKYGCEAHQDCSLCASIFTEMVKGDSLENGLESLKLMESKLLEVPEVRRIKASMVLHAFRAAMINRENILNGLDEKEFVINIEED